MNHSLDFYFEKANEWQAAVKALRKVVIGCGLNEEMKWGVPCYTYRSANEQEKAGSARNVVLIHDFKTYCALLFFKGALMKDEQGILIQQTNNVQAARQLRFTDVTEVKKLQPILETYIYEAISIEKAGLKVNLKTTTEFSVPAELRLHLDTNERLKKAFFSLTPGRQRAYLLHFSSPKQSNTREARIQKAMPRIIAGKGLTDL